MHYWAKAKPTGPQDKELLKTSGLEPPTIVNLFEELKAQGLISKVPISLTEGKEELLKLLKTQTKVD